MDVPAAIKISENTLLKVGDQIMDAVNGEVHEIIAATGLSTGGLQTISYRHCISGTTIEVGMSITAERFLLVAAGSF